MNQTDPTAEEVAKASKNPLELVQLLFQPDGVVREELEAALKQHYNIKHEAQLTITRMNFVGGIRASGFEVQGGRQNRSLPYKVVGRREYKDTQTIEEYGGDAWEWVQSLTPVTQDDRPWVERQLLQMHGVNVTHERSWGYIWCYELARDRGYKFVDQRTGGSCIIMQKHQKNPRFRVFNFNLTHGQLARICEELATISLQAVRALNVTPTQLHHLKENYPGGWVGKRRQAVYQVDRILEGKSAGIGNSRLWEMIRKCHREIDWRMIWTEEEAFPYCQVPDQKFYPWTSARPDVKKVIDTWRTLNEAKQRQLAVTRDYQYLQVADGQSLCFLGYRGNDPCTTHLLDPMVGASGIAQIVEKSLNYKRFEDGSPVPGGGSGTADFNVWRTALWLREFMPEITFINAGGYDGGGHGLPAHKSIWALESDDVYSYTYDFPFPYLTKDQILA